jgi:hypothetical protein
MSLTPLEKQVLEAKRAGQNVELASQTLPGGRKVVSLRELAQAEELPVPPPLQVTPQVQEVPLAPRAQALAQPADDQFDPEKLKGMLFGPEQPAESTQQADEPAPVAAPAPVPSLPQVCKRCGWDQSRPITEEPTEEDKTAFLESVLGGGRFVRDITLMGGKLIVRFRTLTVAEEDLILANMKRKLDNNEVANQDEWQLGYTRMRMFGMLASLVMGSNVRMFQEMSLTADLDQLVNAAFGSLPLPFHGILYQALNTFDDLVRVLTSRAYDPNFWKGPAAG